jgi:anti-sigma B factor antagonist
MPQTRFPEPFEVHVLGHAGGIRVEVLGELDLATAPRLAEALGALPSGGELVVDLAGVTLMDSSGVAVLLRAGQGRSLVFVRPDRHVRRVLGVSGLTVRD